jgi:multiple sugar transport system permease protein
MQSILGKRGTARPRSSHVARWKRIWGLILIAPWVIGLLIFKLIPIFASLVLSLTDFYLLEPKAFQFIGLRNYVGVFTDGTTWLVLLRTITLALMIIPVQTGAAILLAAILSNQRLRMKNLLRMLFFLPSIIPATAAVYMWQGFVNPNTGWLNRLILGPIGLAGWNHLYARGEAQSLFIVSSLWAIGPGFLIIMGAMQGIPPEVLEAAKVDGANRLRRFVSITLPMVSPAVFFTLVINLTTVFGGAILLDRGHNLNTNTSSYDGYVYYVLFRLFKLGYATSVAWVFFLFIMALVLILFFSSKYWVYFPDQER